MRMRTYGLLLICLTLCPVLVLHACGPSPQQVSQDLARLKSLTTQANARLDGACTPPAPQVGAVPMKPAICGPLVECAHLSGGAAKSGDQYLHQVASGGIGDSLYYIAQRDAAFALCAELDIRPIVPPPVAAKASPVGPAPAAPAPPPAPAPAVPAVPVRPAMPPVPAPAPAPAPTAHATAPNEEVPLA